ncbi:MAG: A1 family peptidase [Rhodanobacteraceae bacterium]|nr:A1 family peptidase [Rhodanobacteraceae bacterium]
MARRFLRLSTSLAYARGGYSVALSLGSEGDSVNVLLDTGSSSLAVTKERYKPQRDSLLSPTPYAQRINYGKGRLAGPVLRTHVGVGDRDERRGVDAVALTYVEGEVPYFFRDADGILGLAYRHLNTAYDLTTLLEADGHNPALTWPWPYAELDASAQAEFFEQLRQQPRLALQPLFSALEAHDIFADVFALTVRRSVAHVLDEDASTEQLHGNPLNRGTLVLGGGEECQDLYDGAFADLRVVDDIYYNVNLLSVQVGDQDPIPAPKLEEKYTAGSASNAIIDTGSSFVMLEGTVYDAVIAAFGVHDPRLPELVTQFNDAFANNRGLPNSAIRFADWPVLRLRFEAPDGSETCLRCDPSNYWQHNGFYARQSVFLLLRQVPGWPNQSVLGLPLMADCYVVFDRSNGEHGRVRFARAQTQD